MKALKAGYTSVMIDGSKLDFEANIAVVPPQIICFPSEEKNSDIMMLITLLFDGGPTIILTIKQSSGLHSG